MPELRNGSKGDSNPGSLDCESDILPLNYHAPQLYKTLLCLPIGITLCIFVFPAYFVVLEIVL